MKPANNHAGGIGWGGWTRTTTVLINSEVSYRLDHAPTLRQITIRCSDLLDIRQLWRGSLGGGTRLMSVGLARRPTAARMWPLPGVNTGISTGPSTIVSETNEQSHANRTACQPPLTYCHSGQLSVRRLKLALPGPRARLFRRTMAAPGRLSNDG
jgi:hypothetical protein